MTHFDRVIHGGNDDYVVLLRRSAPRVIPPSVDVLESCDVDDPPTRFAEVRHHLLFSALYHKSRSGAELQGDGFETRCRVRVPDGGGRLAFELGYRQPHEADRGATLRARVRVEVDGKSHEVAAQTLRIVPRAGAGPQLPYRRVAVDLDPWASREIVLVFHTRLESGITVHCLDFKDFAQVYRNVRLESREDPAP